ncbi:MAG: hypothetical protein PHS53_00970 [Candidatus Pacebacteria bacterium]|nr:hypothetical protein [Candidatus Paceibacterota bacterium]MDD5356709.1 hypothetical protein [Candidatus Paceibacterota bacterium]
MGIFTNGLSAGTVVLIIGIVAMFIWAAFEIATLYGKLEIWVNNWIKEKARDQPPPKPKPGERPIPDKKAKFFALPVEGGTVVAELNQSRHRQIFQEKGFFYDYKYSMRTPDGMHFNPLWEKDHTLAKFLPGEPTYEHYDPFWDYYGVLRRPFIKWFDEFLYKKYKVRWIGLFGNQKRFRVQWNGARKEGTTQEAPRDQVESHNELLNYIPHHTYVIIILKDIEGKANIKSDFWVKTSYTAERGAELLYYTLPPGAYMVDLETGMRAPFQDVVANKSVKTVRANADIENAGIFKGFLAKVRDEMLTKTQGNIYIDNLARFDFETDDVAAKAEEAAELAIHKANEQTELARGKAAEVLAVGLAEAEVAAAKDKAKVAGDIEYAKTLTNISPEAAHVLANQALSELSETKNLNSLTLIFGDTGGKYILPVSGGSNPVPAPQGDKSSSKKGGKGEEKADTSADASAKPEEAATPAH